jgi:hypothetical protein
MKPKTTELIAIKELKPHPRNYRSHPEDQLVHLVNSIKQHGFYRNVVVAKDNTILAGHGVVQAGNKMGLEKVPCIRLDLDPDSPLALKVLSGDNEISRLSEIDDRALSEMLKEIKDSDIDGLLGTGYDDKMLSNLLFVTRPESEIKDHNEAAQWVGMPEFEKAERPNSIYVNFRNDYDKLQFGEKNNIKLDVTTRTCWWPDKEMEDDVSSVKFKE